jgi:hypothetical protein
MSTAVAAGSCPPFLCIEIGTTANPCRCKVRKTRYRREVQPCDGDIDDCWTTQIVGPTLALIVALLLVVLCWPLGVLVYILSRPTARRLFGTPASTYLATKSAIPF